MDFHAAQPTSYFSFQGLPEQSIILPYVGLTSASSTGYSISLFLRLDAAAPPAGPQAATVAVQLISDKAALSIQLAQTDRPRVYRVEVTCGSRMAHATAALSLGCWHHIVVVHTARRLLPATVDLWLNAVHLIKQGTVPIPGGALSSAKWGTNLVGGLACPTLYSGSLPASMVPALYMAGPSLPTAWHSIPAPAPVLMDPDIRHTSLASPVTVVGGARHGDIPAVAALLMPGAGTARLGGRTCGVWASSGTFSSMARMSAPSHASALPRPLQVDLSRGLASQRRQATLGSGIAVVGAGSGHATLQDPLLQGHPTVWDSPLCTLTGPACCLAFGTILQQLAAQPDNPALHKTWVQLCAATGRQLAVDLAFRESFLQIRAPELIMVGLRGSGISTRETLGPEVAGALLQLTLACRCSAPLAMAAVQAFLLRPRVWCACSQPVQLAWLRALCSIVQAVGPDIFLPGDASTPYLSMESILAGLRCSLGSQQAVDAWAADAQELQDVQALWVWLLCQGLEALVPAQVHGILLLVQDTFAVNDTKLNAFAGAAGEAVGAGSTLSAIMRSVAARASRTSDAGPSEDVAAFASRRSVGGMGSPLPLLLQQLENHSGKIDRAAKPPREALAAAEPLAKSLTGSPHGKALSKVLMEVAALLQLLGTAASPALSEVLLRTLLAQLAHPLMHMVFFHALATAGGATTAVLAAMEACADAERSRDCPPPAGHPTRVLLMGMHVLAALLGHWEAWSVAAAVIVGVERAGTVPIGADTEACLAVMEPAVRQAFRCSFPSITASRAYRTVGMALHSLFAPIAGELARGAGPAEALATGPGTEPPHLLASTLHVAVKGLMSLSSSEQVPASPATPVRRATIGSPSARSARGARRPRVSMHVASPADLGTPGAPRHRSSTLSFQRRPTPDATPDRDSPGLSKTTSSGSTGDWQVVSADGAQVATDTDPFSEVGSIPMQLTLEADTRGVPDGAIGGHSRSASVLSESGRAEVHVSLGRLPGQDGARVDIIPNLHAGKGVDVDQGAPTATRDAALTPRQSLPRSTRVMAAVLRVLMPGSALHALKGRASALAPSLRGIQPGATQLPSAAVLRALQCLATPCLQAVRQLGRDLQPAPLPLSATPGTALPSSTMAKLRDLGLTSSVTLWSALENLAAFLQQGLADAAAVGEELDLSTQATVALAALQHVSPRAAASTAAAMSDHVFSGVPPQHGRLSVPSAIPPLMATLRLCSAKVRTRAAQAAKAPAAKQATLLPRLASAAQRLVLEPLLWCHSVLSSSSDEGDHGQPSVARSNTFGWLKQRGWQALLLGLVDVPCVPGVYEPAPSPPCPDVSSTLQASSEVALDMLVALHLAALGLPGGDKVWQDTWAQCVAMGAGTPGLAAAAWTAVACRLLRHLHRNSSLLRGSSSAQLATNVHAVCHSALQSGLRECCLEVAPAILDLLPALHESMPRVPQEALWGELRFLHLAAHAVAGCSRMPVVSACVKPLCDAVQHALHKRLPDVYRFSVTGPVTSHQAPEVQYQLPGGPGGVLGATSETAHIEILLYLLATLAPLLALHPDTHAHAEQGEWQELAGNVVMGILNTSRFGPLEVDVRHWRDEALGASTQSSMLPRHRAVQPAVPTRGPSVQHATTAERAADALQDIQATVDAVVQRVESCSPAEEPGEQTVLRALPVPVLEAAAWDSHADSMHVGSTPGAPGAAGAGETAPPTPPAELSKNHVWALFRLGVATALASVAGAGEEALASNARQLAKLAASLRLSVGRASAPWSRTAQAAVAAGPKKGTLAVEAVDGECVQGGLALQHLDASAALVEEQGGGPGAGWKLDSHDATPPVMLKWGAWGPRQRLVQSSDGILAAQSYGEYSSASNAAGESGGGGQAAPGPEGDVGEEALAAQLAAAGVVRGIHETEERTSDAEEEEEGGAGSGGSPGAVQVSERSSPDSARDRSSTSASAASLLLEEEEEADALASAAMAQAAVAQLGSTASLVVRARLLNAKAATRGTLFIMPGNKYVWRPSSAPSATSDAVAAEWVDVPSIVRAEGEDSDDEVEVGTQQALARCGWSPHRTRPISWASREVAGLWMRSYCLQSTALEVEVARHGGPRRRRYMFAFVRRDVRDRVASHLIKDLGGSPPTAGSSVALSSKVPFAPPHSRPSEVLREAKLTEAWESRQLSNLHYLLALNSIAGRTVHDTNQYPVFPWVLSDYSSQHLDLAHPASYRDLRRPMGALTRARLAEFRSRFESLGGYDPDAGDAPAGILPFMYGSHYSTSVGTVMHYLLRLYPFTGGHALTQEGHFDVPDRLFASVQQSWRLATEGLTEVKELTPEWFTSPAFLLNLSSYDFGTTQDGTTVSDVQLPPWTETYTYPYKSLVPREVWDSALLPDLARPRNRTPAQRARAFIAAQREALEGEHVSGRLHSWVDLIFGCKQRGEAAIKADNVFYYCTYPGAVDVEAVTDPTVRKALKLQILHYGQIPNQLLTRPHPPRRGAAADFTKPHPLAADLRDARSIAHFAAAAPEPTPPPAAEGKVSAAALAVTLTFHHARIHRSLDGGYSLWRPVYAPGLVAGDLGGEQERVAYSLGDAISLGGVPPPCTLMVTAAVADSDAVVLRCGEDGTPVHGSGEGAGGPPPPLAYPIGYTRQEMLVGGGADDRVCIWSAVPPAGYVSLGCIASLVTAGEGATADGDEVVAPGPSAGQGASATLGESGGSCPPPMDAMVCVHQSLVLQAPLSTRVHVSLDTTEISVDVPVAGRPSEATPEQPEAKPVFKRQLQKHTNAMWAVQSPTNSFLVPKLSAILHGRQQRSAEGGEAGALAWNGAALPEVADPREWESFQAASALAFTLNPVLFSTDPGTQRRLPSLAQGMSSPWSYASSPTGSEEDIVALATVSEASGRIMSISADGELDLLRVAVVNLPLPSPPPPPPAGPSGMAGVVTSSLTAATTTVADAVGVVGEAVGYVIGEEEAGSGAFTGWTVRAADGTTSSLYSLVRHVGLTLHHERPLAHLQDFMGVATAVAPPKSFHVPLSNLASAARTMPPSQTSPHPAHVQLSPAVFTPSGRVAIVGAGPGAGVQLTAVQPDTAADVNVVAGLTLPPTSPTAAVSCVAVAPDGDWLAVGYDDGSAEVWAVSHLHAGWGMDLRSPCAGSRPHRRLLGACMAEAGDLMVAGSDTAWTVDGSMHPRAPPEEAVAGPAVTCLAISASADAIVVGHVGEAWLYELSRGRPLRRWMWATPAGASDHTTSVVAVGAAFVADNGVMVAWSGGIAAGGETGEVSTVVRYEVGAYAEAPSAIWHMPSTPEGALPPRITAFAVLDARAPRNGYAGHTATGGGWGPAQADAFQAAVRAGGTKRAFGETGPREVVAVGDAAGGITLLDALDASPLAAFRSAACPVRSITGSPCAGFFVSGGGGGRVTVHALPALPCVAGTRGSALVDTVGEHVAVGRDKVAAAAMASASTVSEMATSGRGLAMEVGSIVKGVFGSLWSGGRGSPSK